MLTFLGLPAELRHQILLAALPDEIAIGSDDAYPIWDLKLVCQQFKEDLQNLGPSYRATYILKDPIYMPRLRQKTGIDEIKHIRLNAWLLTNLNLTLGISPVVLAVVALPHTMNLWIDALTTPKCTLPKRGLQTIELHINPVPEEARRHSRAWKTWLVNDSHGMGRIWSDSDSVIAEIVGKIVLWMQITAGNQQPRLLISSTMNQQSRLWIPELFKKIGEAQALGMDVKFESDCFEDARQAATLESLFEILQSTCDLDTERYLEGEPLNRLRTLFDNDQLARHLFYRSAAEQPQRTVRTILYFFEYVRYWGGNPTTIRELTARQRALLIRIAVLIGTDPELEEQYVISGGVRVADLHVGYRPQPRKHLFAKEIDAEAMDEWKKASDELSDWNAKANSDGGACFKESPENGLNG